MEKRFNAKDYYDEVSIRCDCGCGYLEVTRWNDPDFVEYFVYFYHHGFYAYQNNLLGTAIDRIIKAVKILLGKEYQLYEITLTDEQFEKFRKNINEIGGQNKA